LTKPSDASAIRRQSCFPVLAVCVGRVSQLESLAQALHDRFEHVHALAGRPVAYVKQAKRIVRLPLRQRLQVTGDGYTVRNDLDSSDAECPLRAVPRVSADGDDPAGPAQGGVLHAPYPDAMVQ